MNLLEEEKEFLLSLSRQTLINCTLSKKTDIPKTDSVILNTKCGAFVTLHKQGRLRGCIGYIEGYKPLVDTIAEMTKSAALKDPRFNPVVNTEVADINIEISVLSPLKTITDINEIKVGTHGIIISLGYNHGLLLPQVATEQGWNRDEFLANTCKKAGLAREAWKDKDAKIQIFSALVFGEKEYL